MKNEMPFNPILIPNLPLADSQPAQPAIKLSKITVRKVSRPTKTRRVLDPKASAVRFARKVGHKAKTSWRQIKGGLQVRLARLNPEQLKRVLLACGVAATVALVIIALAKHAVLIIVLLTMLGALVVLKIWSRILTLGI